jgi:hypothetical protein
MPSDSPPGLHFYIHFIDESRPDPLNPTIMITADTIIRLANTLKAAALTEIANQQQISQLKSELDTLTAQEADLNKPEVQQAIDDAFAAVASATPSNSTTVTGLNTGTTSGAGGPTNVGNVATPTEPAGTTTPEPAAPQQDPNAPNQTPGGVAAPQVAHPQPAPAEPAPQPQPQEPTPQP